LRYPYFELSRTQIVKRADVTLAMCSLDGAFTAEKRPETSTITRLIVRDSSWSACMQAAGLAAEVGRLHLAYARLVEPAFNGLHNLHHNVSNGLTSARFAGTSIAGVAHSTECGTTVAN
jgi:alpha,alpha-trehalose phosphorylase